MSYRIRFLSNTVSISSDFILKMQMQILINAIKSSCKWNWGILCRNLRSEQYPNLCFNILGQRRIYASLFHKFKLIFYLRISLLWTFARHKILTISLHVYDYYSLSTFTIFGDVGLCNKPKAIISFIWFKMICNETTNDDSPDCIVC